MKNRIIFKKYFSDHEQKFTKNFLDILSLSYSLNNFPLMKTLVLLIVLILLFKQSQTQQQVFEKSSILTHIDYLYKNLNGESYWQHNQNYRFMLTWQHMKGLYQSRVHFNVLDKKNRIFTEQFRSNIFKIDDVNMFVSSFVLYGLLEAQSLGTLKIDEHKFSQTLQSIAEFRDKNTPSGIPQYSFWPQQYVNGTWSAKSVNLINLINLSPSFPPSMNNWLINHGLGIFTMIKNLGKFFCIPPDNDDSAVNLALLGFLKETNSPHFQFFNSLNYKKLQFYDRSLKYAYRPFENNFTENKRCNQIDPRTYYVLNEFINLKYKEASMKNETPELILPTTWLLNQDQQVPNKVIMPFETNNVDATVSANFLFGLTFQVMTDQLNPSQLSNDLIKMIHSTVDLIQFVIDKVAKDRFDLILVYYPSKYDFYWFVSRTLNLLKRNYQSKLILDQYKDFKSVFDRLQSLMKTQGTENILGSKNIYNSNAIYWNQFLGNYAKKQRNDDALFSTALALNALLDTWASKDKNQLSYDVDTPLQVKQSIKKGISYIQTFIDKQANSKVGYKMKLGNAFFSGSMKIFKTSFPYFYPANVHYDKNGKNFDPNNSELKDLQFGSKYYVKGYIEQSEYKQFLSKKWFGSQVPTTFTGFNDGIGLAFPYWSSKAISQIMMITALSKYLKISQTQKLQVNLQSIRSE